MTYWEQAKEQAGRWTLFFVKDREEADKIARWLRRQECKAKFLELDDRYLLAVKAPA
jgi:hypothetical protein